MKISICPTCRGKGTVVMTYDEYGIADPKDVTCPVCQGHKYVQPFIEADAAAVDALVGFIEGLREEFISQHMSVKGVARLVREFLTAPGAAIPRRR